MNYKALVQATWEDTFSKKEIRRNLKKKLSENQEFADALDAACEAVDEHFQTNRIYWYPRKLQRWYLLRCMDITIDDIVLELFVSVLLQQRTTIQSIVGSLIPLMEYKDPFDSCKTLAEIIAVVGINTTVFDLIMPRDSDLGSLTIEANYELDEEIKQYIADTMYLPPMLCKPKHIYKNWDYDYLSQQSSKILGSANHHENKIALDVLNIMNSTKLSLDTYILGFDEQPNKVLDTIEKIEQFNRMAKSSRKVYDMLIEQGNEFYNCHKYDKRGRLYSLGYQVHIQSTDFKKSLINLAEQHTIPLD